MTLQNYFTSMIPLQESLRIPLSTLWLSVTIIYYDVQTLIKRIFSNEYLFNELSANISKNLIAKKEKVKNS